MRVDARAARLWKSARDDFLASGGLVVAGVVLAAIAVRLFERAVGLSRAAEISAIEGAVCWVAHVGGEVVDTAIFYLGLVPTPFGIHLAYVGHAFQPPFC